MTELSLSSICPTDPDSSSTTFAYPFIVTFQFFPDPSPGKNKLDP